MLYEVITELAASASYEVFNAAGTRALLTALAQDSKVNVVSSPSLMVLDNHTATIRVGDQVPVRTSETTNTSGITTSNTTDTNTDSGVSALVTSVITSYSIHYTKLYERGIALVSVLWFLMLLTLIATTLSLTSRSSYNFV